jgi:transketolase
MYKKISSDIRKKILNISYKKKTSHVGSNLSIVDILVVLYKNFIKKNNKNQFILSKGHACLSLYCVLNYFKYFSEKYLSQYGDNNSIMMCHVSHKIPGINISTGSLGHGLPIATGKAYINKRNKIFILMSDGELNEGSNWESFLFISHHKILNIKIIIDYNKIQSLDLVKNVIKIEPIAKKFQSFGFEVSMINGHNYDQIYKALNKKNKQPHVIIANTIKGKGVKFMENSILWHYKSPSKDDLAKALKNL